MKTMLCDALADRPGYVLRRASHAMITELTALLAEIDVRVSDATLMVQINANDEATSSEIGRILDIQRANMAPLLDRLDKMGFIRRVPLDRKSSGIALTEEGEAKLEAIKAVVDRFEGDLMARIPEEHRAHFLPALRALWK